MKFRKKPVVVEAKQWFKDGDHPAVFVHREGGHVWVNGQSYIENIDGRYLVCPGDWIITKNDQNYAVKPDIFEATYELVEPSGE